jgi:hypothetical protein
MNVVQKDYQFLTSTGNATAVAQAGAGIKLYLNGEYMATIDDAVFVESVTRARAIHEPGFAEELAKEIEGMVGTPSDLELAALMDWLEAWAKNYR